MPVGFSPLFLFGFSPQRCCACRHCAVQVPGHTSIHACPGGPTRGISSHLKPKKKPFWILFGWFGGAVFFVIRRGSRDQGGLWGTPQHDGEVVLVVHEDDGPAHEVRVLRVLSARLFLTTQDRGVIFGGEGKKSRRNNVGWKPDPPPPPFNHSRAKSFEARRNEGRGSRGDEGGSARLQSRKPSPGSRSWRSIQNRDRRPLRFCSSRWTSASPGDGAGRCGGDARA